MDSATKRSLITPQLPLDQLSKRLSDRVTVPTDSPVPECTTCGVCCVFALIVPVSHDESANIDPCVDILLDDIEEEIVIDRVLPRRSDGRCIHLAGELGRSIGCSIYEGRPQPCRDFDAGSDRCHEYRRMYGIEGQLADDAYATAIAKLKEGPETKIIEDVCIVSNGTVERMTYSAATGVAEQESHRLFKLVAFLTGGEEYEIHSFEYGRENWFESDLLGLTLEEAISKIEEQVGH